MKRAFFGWMQTLIRMDVRWLRSQLTSQKKFLLTSQTACLYRCAATGLSHDWSNFFSTEWSNPVSVMTGLSIDNSKNIFFGHLIVFEYVNIARVLV